MVNQFAELVQLPDAAAHFLEDSFCTLTERKEVLLLMLDAMDDYFLGEEAVCISKLQQAAAQSGLHEYVIDFLFLILCAKPLRYTYKRLDLPEKVYIASMRDLKYKVLECHKVYHIWGTFVFEWFRGFFLCDRMAFGRLQYERIPFPYDAYGQNLKRGDTVYNCHIPACGPLTTESVLKSLKEAYGYYQPELKDGILPVVCLSWLLYPPHYMTFPENSNIQRFYKLFHIIDQHQEENCHDFWRIFGCQYTKDPAGWPVDTTLQANFKQYLASGNTMGEGFGILLFDGENIVG